MIFSPSEATLLGRASALLKCEAAQKVWPRLPSLNGPGAVEAVPPICRGWGHGPTRFFKAFQSF